MAPFDPYHNWLGIPPHEQPANFYRLLGLVLFESNPNVISQAADRQSMHVGSFQNGPASEYCHHLMGEIGQATACLLDPQQKAVYDNHLQDILSARGERSVMAAPPPPGGMPLAGFAPGNFGQQPMQQPQQSAWSNGPEPQGSFGAPGEMAMPQFALPPGMGSSPAMGVPMQEPMGFQPNGLGSGGMGNGGMMQPGSMHAPMMNPATMNPHSQQPMQPFLQGPPAPMMMPSGQQPRQPNGQSMPQTMPQPQSPRMPAPAPFPKAQRPMPVANRVAGAPAPVPVSSGPVSSAAAVATSAAPQPPPPGPPRPVDELESLAATPIRKKFLRRKRNEIPMEYVMGGIGVVVVITGFVIYAATMGNGGGEEHGLDGLANSITPTTTTTAADAAAADLKKAAKDSSKKAETANASKKSRAITTAAPDKPKHKPAKVAGAPPQADSDIESPNQFGPPSRRLDDGGNAGANAGNNAGNNNNNNAPPQEFHATGPDADNDAVMEDIIGGEQKK